MIYDMFDMFLSYAILEIIAETLYKTLRYCILSTTIRHHNANLITHIKYNQIVSVITQLLLKRPLFGTLQLSL